MTKDELKERTKKFALVILKLVEDQPITIATTIIFNQLIRSGTSVAANYRAACKARSIADFISKISIVEEECDETLFWLELIAESNIIAIEKVKEIINEADELTAIFTSSGKTARQNNPKWKIQNQKST